MIIIGNWVTHLISRWFVFFCFLSTAGFGQNLRSSANSLRLKYKIPQIAFAVVSADSIQEMGFVGYHRWESHKRKDEASAGDYYHLGSNTKAITGFIAAYLVEQKKISWETKFFDLFGMWKQTSNKFFFDITLEDLLSHRALILPYTSGAEYLALPNFTGTNAEKRKQFCKYVLKNEAVVPKNEIFNYSNAGYSIAALMLEEASGKTWEELVDEVIGQKIKLKYKIGWPNRFNVNQPWGHWIENDTFKSLSPETQYDLSLAEPAGDISMPIGDYAKFIQKNLQGLQGQDNFLSAKSYVFLHFGKEQYAIGWGNSLLGENQISEHAGSDGTFFCYTQIDKRNNRAYIIILNCATDEGQEGLFELLGIMKRKYNKM